MPTVKDPSVMQNKVHRIASCVPHETALVIWDWDRRFPSTNQNQEPGNSKYHFNMAADSKESAIQFAQPLCENQEYNSKKRGNT